MTREYLLERIAQAKAHHQSQGRVVLGILIDASSYNVLAARECRAYVDSRLFGYPIQIEDRLKSKFRIVSQDRATFRAVERWRKRSQNR